MSRSCLSDDQSRGKLYKSVSPAVAWSKSINQFKNSGQLNSYFRVAVILTFWGPNLTVPEAVDRVTEIPGTYLI